jgi:hypothetical protein
MLIGRTLPPSRNIAGAPAKRWRVTTSPKTRAGLARASGNQRAWAIVTDDVIKVWYGIVRGNREYLIFKRMEPDEIRSPLTIEQAASELVDLLGDEDPHNDLPERQLLLGAVFALIEERHEQWSE